MITVAPSLVPIFADDLTRLGVSGFLADRPVRAYDPESTHLDVLRAITDPTDLIARFDAVAAGWLMVPTRSSSAAGTWRRSSPLTATSACSDTPMCRCWTATVSRSVTRCSRSHLQDAGIIPSPRGYPRPAGARETALIEASRLLTPNRVGVR